jgi:hypothetical protein
VVGVTEAQEDHDKGWSWTHSVLVDGGAALGGLAVGAAIVATLPEDAAAGVLTLAAGGVMFGAYAVDKAFHEHWSEDIHDHGVIGGVAQGSWNVVKGAGTSIVDDAKGVWHGVTSLF